MEAGRVHALRALRRLPVGGEAALGGYGGKKYAYADKIEFYPVPDEAARVAGLQSGDYDLSLDIGNDQYEVLKDAPGVIAEILTPTNWDVYLPQLEVADDGEPGHPPGGPGGHRHEAEAAVRSRRRSISCGSIRA